MNSYAEPGRNAGSPQPDGPARTGRAPRASGKPGDTRAPHRPGPGTAAPGHPSPDPGTPAGTPRDSAAPGPFTFIDLFAGIGGLRRGFETIGGTCVFTSEWDRFSQKTYRANYPHDAHPIFGDITARTDDDIPPHDVLLAGFPCQPFSIAGVSKKNALNRPHGFACESQGTLFFEIRQILERHRPKAFLLENVRNLASHDRGRTFSVIRKVLEEDLGYHVQYRILDAKSWLPQHRERIFIAGFRDPCAFRFDALECPEPASGPRLGTILHPENGAEAPEPPYTEGNIGRVSPRYTLSTHLWTYLQEYAARHRARGNGFGFGLCGPEDVARTLSARYYKDGSEILIHQDGGRPPRRLTPRECARLMGFDKPGGQDFVIPVSDTQAYRQFGNSVAVPVVEAVARLMSPFIHSA
ncbi:DNA (cytosine-5-)-methyltransferase [Phaeovibrio sulfidiphilus]|uniref:Cytosine-specific methyltransferase n=1 Tax=Phaeovibrio sulfidiphilus TaxID=1220600 RepID=A0A8J7CP16_9PROT|nr:DNA (cytosine-5-)-methyltransferase [Phaeovibrio sulfidiphilus]MBE1236512.1 DNA (cytosine-5-)-methyltransferase [Phaeovibrio sulfidiphilus]